jgi:hypothetical protein
MLTTSLAISSSLQRLEETTKTIDVGVREIKTFLQRLEMRAWSVPLLSALGTEESEAMINFSQRCMLAAEVSQSWTSISIEDWIKAGWWWLLKVEDQPIPLPCQEVHGLTTGGAGTHGASYSN